MSLDRRDYYASVIRKEADDIWAIAQLGYAGLDEEISQGEYEYLYDLAKARLDYIKTGEA